MTNLERARELLYAIRDSEDGPQVRGALLNAAREIPK